ncbi:phosphoribosyltransferase-like protein [Jimgerdemannia flammicorona]|uniref:ribose-phosphate diphosphokinase n=1 Tax=Jimgerdemannia flammicorona TaxID=994334 RepID=A0A433D1S0_9FUNG|nr:phosphoribosyltransferase-like protein [Jimgerdemannia flammicorona]
MPTNLSQPPPLLSPDLTPTLRRLHSLGAVTLDSLANRPPLPPATGTSSSPSYSPPTRPSFPSSTFSSYSQTPRSGTRTPSSYRDHLSSFEADATSRTLAAAANILACGKTPRSMRNTKIFGGSSHPELTTLICERLGVAPAPVSLKQFSNQELSVEIGISIRNEDVFIIQSGSISTNDHIMELLIMINACKIASARRITAILPYFPYCKQSKKKKHRTAITAKQNIHVSILQPCPISSPCTTIVIANMLSVAGVDHIITMDLHASQMQGFFTKPVDNLYAEPSITKWIVLNVPGWENGVVVCKNAGGAKRKHFIILYCGAGIAPHIYPSSSSHSHSVTSLADSLHLDFALIHKDRRPASKRPHAPSSHTLAPITDAPSLISRTADEDENNEETETVAIDQPAPVPVAVSVVADEEGAESTITLVGDVRGRIAFLVDDIIDGCQSFLDGAEHLMGKCGAKAVYLIATHGVLSADSAKEVGACDSVHKVRILGICYGEEESGVGNWEWTE